MKHHVLKRPVVAALAVGTVSLLGIAVPSSALADSCAPPATPGPTIADPVYGDVDPDSGTGYVGAVGDQGYVEASGSQAGNGAVFGSTSDGSASGYVGVNGTSALPSYCVTQPTPPAQP